MWTRLLRRLGLGGSSYEEFPLPPSPEAVQCWVEKSLAGAVLVGMMPLHQRNNQMFRLDLTGSCAHAVLKLYYHQSPWERLQNEWAGVKATFFVLGWVAERHPELVRSIRDRGHEIGSHGYAHQRITTETPEQFREETRRSKQLLEDAVGCPVIGYRAASYSIMEQNLWALAILAEEGFLYDSSIFPVRHDRYGIPGYERFCHRLRRKGREDLIEFPISTVKLAGSTFLSPEEGTCIFFHTA